MARGALLDALVSAGASIAAGALFLLLFGVVGATASCAGSALDEVSLVGTTLVRDCASSVLPGYNDVRTAIHSGGASWVSVVFDVLGCVEPVVRDELAAHGILAQLDELELEQLADRVDTALARINDTEKPRDAVARLLSGFELELEPAIASAVGAGAGEPPLGLASGELARAKLAIALERAAKRVHVRRAAAKGAK